MSATFRKTPKGEIEVSSIADGAPILISRSFRIVEGFRVDIAHWLDPNAMRCWFALRNPCIPMLDNREDDEVFGHHSDDGYGDSRLVRYEGVVLMLVNSLQSDPFAYLLDTRGNVLAGGNIYPEGNYCLGDSFNPLSLQPVEMLLHNEANDDLVWKGDWLQGSWQDNHFLCTTWPTYKHCQTPPDAILEDIARWWPT